MSQNTNINVLLVTFLKWKLVLLVKDLEEFGTWHGHWVFRTINVQLSQQIMKVHSLFST
jgi:hypothetical protein